MERHFSNVLDPNYCFPNPMELKIDMEDGVVLNGNKEVLFRMEKASSLGSGRILQNRSSEPICSLDKKVLTAHGRWEVYKGNDTSILSFIVKRPSMMTKDNKIIVLDVFLGNNIEVSFCKVKAGRRKNSCEIYTGETTLAKVNATKGNNDGMTVWIEANVDLAFIVAVLMIVDQKKINKLKKVAKCTAQGLLGALSVAGTTMYMINNMNEIEDHQEDQEQTRSVASNADDGTDVRADGASREGEEGGRGNF